MLRRLKETVASELPQKREHLLRGECGEEGRVDSVWAESSGMARRCMHRDARWSKQPWLKDGMQSIILRLDIARADPCSCTFLPPSLPPAAVPPSAYQQGLFCLMQRDLQGSSGLKGVNNGGRARVAAQAGATRFCMHPAKQRQLGIACINPDQLPPIRLPAVQC